MTPAISSRTLLRRMVELGLVPANVRRVVLDINVDDVPVMHVESIGQPELLEVVRTLATVDIVVKPQPEPATDKVCNCAAHPYQTETCPMHGRFFTKGAIL